MPRTVLLRNANCSASYIHVLAKFQGVKFDPIIKVRPQEDSPHDAYHALLKVEWIKRSVVLCTAQPPEDWEMVKITAFYANLLNLLAIIPMWVKVFLVVPVFWKQDSNMAQLHRSIRNAFVRPDMPRLEVLELPEYIYTLSGEIQTTCTAALVRHTLAHLGDKF